MSASLDTIKRLIEECSEVERKALRSYLHKLQPHALEKEWGIDTDILLTSIARSSDLTKRGIRGIIAEAVFVNDVIPLVAHLGWREAKVGGADRPYDALLKKDNFAARIQVKLQRLERGEPKLYYPRHYTHAPLFVVEVQRTRTGGKRTRAILPGTHTKLTTTESLRVETRPYSFGDFDILAVNMHPSTGDWKSFRYTVASWLLARSDEPTKIAIFQPVAGTQNDVWTDDLGTCLGWLEGGERRQVLTDLIHLRKRLKSARSRRNTKSAGR